MQDKDAVIVNKLIHYSNDISTYIANLDKTAFINDSKTMAACAFCLGQIGELTKKISPEFKENHPQIPWHKIYGLRNRLFHDYDGVDKLQMWIVIREDIPKLKKDLAALISSL